MGLLVYKAQNYDHTAEREQYRVICEHLRRIFSGKDESCLFLANYNLSGSEFDGIVFKNDAIIVVEFKNYGGKITAAENGDWTNSEGVKIKGGAGGKTPFHQIRSNRSTLWNTLNYLIPDKFRHIAAVIVFNQPIELNNELSPKVKTWLRVVDNDHAGHMFSDITVAHTDLSDSDILELVDKLNLHPEWLDSEYSDDILENDPEEPDDDDTVEDPKEESSADVRMEVVREAVQRIHLCDLPEMQPKYIFKVESSGIAYKLGDVGGIPIPQTRNKKAHIKWTAGGVKIMTSNVDFDVEYDNEVHNCSDALVIPWHNTTVVLKNESEFARIHILETSDRATWYDFRSNIQNAAECFAAAISEQNVILHTLLSSPTNPIGAYEDLTSALQDLETHRQKLSQSLYDEMKMKWEHLKYLAACRISADGSAMKGLAEQRQYEILDMILHHSRILINKK